MAITKLERNVNRGILNKYRRPYSGKDVTRSNSQKLKAFRILANSIIGYFSATRMLFSR